MLIVLELSTSLIILTPILFSTIMEIMSKKKLTDYQLPTYFTTTSPNMEALLL